MILLNDYELICKILDLVFGHRSHRNPLGTGHTGNRSDREHSVHRSRSVRSDAIEHGSDRTRHRSDVSRSSRRDSHSIPLHHTDPGELSPASMIRHCRSRSRSSSYDIKFRMLIEEVLKLLAADMFPKKTDEFPGGNRPRSSIELQKVPKKSISLPQ